MRQLLIAILLLAVSGNVYALRPEKNYPITPDSMGIPYKNIHLKTSDGYDLNAWLFSPKKDLDKKRVLIISGGDAGNMSYFIYQAFNLTKKGFKVITYDYRGFGKSSDFQINNNYLYYDEFVTDLQTVINYADSNYKDSKIGLYGFSMGTLISGFAAAKNPNIRFYIAEGLILDPIKLVDRIKEATKSDAKGSRLIELPNSANQYASVIKKLNIPFLVFAGTEDTHTPLVDAVEAIKQQKNRELIVYAGGHGEATIRLTASKLTGDRFFDDIAGFADDWLQ